MNLVKQINQYNDNYVFFSDPIKNNVINEGSFIRILYSTHNLLLNGIYLLVTFNDIICEKYFSKYTCNFNTLQHKNLINNIKIIEQNLLKKINIVNKIPQFKIYEQIKNGNIKIFTDVHNNNNNQSLFILKISGIWETQLNFGLTYKFIKVY